MIKKSQLENIVAKSLAKGVEQIDVIGNEGYSLSLSSQNEKIDKYHASTHNVVGIRTIKNQKVGISYSESFEADAIDYMISSAIASSQFVDVDPLQAITLARSEALIETDEKFFQSDQVALTEKQDLAIALEKQVIAKDPLVKSAPYSGYGESQAKRHYLNHLGTYCYHQEKSYFCYTSALLNNDAGDSSIFSASAYSRSWDKLNFQHCVNHSYNQAKPLLTAKPIKAGKYDIVLTPDTLDSLLGCFLGFLSGKMVMEGKSPWADQIGNTVAAPGFSIWDRPRYPQGYLYSGFDGEGHVRNDLNLIENGVLKSYLHNTATAKFLNTQTTGHASRNAKSPLGIGNTHLVIDTGKLGEQDLMAGKCLYITELKGFHSGTNAVSGDFSLAAQGAVCLDGEPNTWFKDVTIAGNFQELIKNIGGMARTQESNQMGTFFSPKIRFQEISISS